MIGIFWVYKDSVFGKAIPLEQGEDGGTGILDSPSNHSDFWEEDTSHSQRFPELLHFDYFRVPRGRVLFSLTEQPPIIYMDKTLFKAETKRRIAEFFNLENSEISWRSDNHYSSDQKEIDRLFGRR